jgi:paraquat-inducible protein B
MNPALLGAFVIGALALAVAGLVVLAGGKLFQPARLWVAHFDESVKGLVAGAPVTFRGVRVGAVKEIRVLLDPRAARLQTPVIFTIEANRFATADGRPVDFGTDQSVAQRLFAQGLRAQLEMQSFVTGQLSINLDFHPDAPPLPLRDAPGAYPEMPTVLSRAAALGRSLEELNLPELVQEVRSAVKSAEQVIASPAVARALASAASMFEGGDLLVAAAHRRLASLGPNLEEVAQRADETLGEVRAFVRGLDQRTLPAATEALRSVQELARRVNAETVPAANLLLGDLDRVARRTEAETLPAAHQTLAEVRQLAASFEQSAAAARLALAEVQQLAAHAGEALDAESPLRYQLEILLQEMAAAARAFRGLTSYLERHPDAIVFGRRGQ